MSNVYEYFSKYFEYLKNNPDNLWFKRKLYGFGWVPVSWQGWLATFLYVGFIVYDFMKIDKNSHSGSDTLIAFAPHFILVTVVFSFICYKTGQKPKWQWGFLKED